MCKCIAILVMSLWALQPSLLQVCLHLEVAQPYAVAL